MTRSPADGTSSREFASHRLPISVPIVSSNEAESLRRCLRSVAGWVSEIVVYLNQTTDHSEEVIRSFGGRVVHGPWLGFRDTKNAVLKEAGQPWVLALDSDEEVSEALRNSIIAFVTNTPPGANGACFPRKVWFLGRWIQHGDWYPDLSLRLFRNGCGTWGGTEEHDKISLQGKSRRIAGDLHHYSFPSMRVQLGKIDVFANYALHRQIGKNASFRPLNAIFRAGWRFLRAYIFRRGFLDGYPGFYIAALTAFSTLYRYTKLREYETLEQHPSPLPNCGYPKCPRASLNPQPPPTPSPVAELPSDK